MPIFTDSNIEVIFGADDAENETPERLKQYFYTNGAYESLRSDLAVRVLVGHKGVGKSALLKRSYLDDVESGVPCAWFRSNDLIDTKEDALREVTFLRMIEKWKIGLLKKSIESFAKKVYGEQSSEILSNFVANSTETLIKFFIKILDDSKKYISNPLTHDPSINIYIDDIDRGWSASSADIGNISALLNALRDIGGAEKRIRFRIGLRSDVYFLVRTSDESTDKIERNIIWLRWTNDEILRLLAKRIDTYFGSYTDGNYIAKMSQGQISKEILSKVMEPTFSGYGHWDKRPIHNVLLSLTRARPRDLIKLLQASAKKAHLKGSSTIMSSHMKDSFEGYSQERLQDIINEFRTEMADIEQLLIRMKPTTKERKTLKSYMFTTDELSKKIGNIIGQTTLRFTNGRPINSRSLIQFLYKIDFITARKALESGEIDRKYFDESRFLANEIAEFGYNWEIHPAYRWALQPQDINDVIASLSR